MMKVVTIATTRCGYCKMLKQQINQKFGNDLNEYSYINIDTAEDLTELEEFGYKYTVNKGIRAVPYTMLISNEDSKYKVIGESIGARPEEVSQLISYAMFKADEKEGVEKESIAKERD